MRVTHAARGYAVFDDFLGRSDFDLVWQFMQSESYQSVHQHGWNRIFTIGTPLAGASYRVYKDRAGLTSDKPSRGMVAFLNRIRATADRFTPWVGRPYRTWKSFSAQAYLYPVDSGLPWHDDGIRSGAFSFYSHRYWGPNWGGELLIADRRNSRRREQPRTVQPGDNVNPKLDRRHASVAHQRGLAVAITPRPNRLVIIMGRYEHCIKRVDAAAGDNMRASISGFFHIKEDVELTGRRPP